MGLFIILAFIAVLTIYLLIVGYSIRWLRRHNKPKAVIWLAVAFWVLLPTWDTITALSYHRYVCATAPDIGLTVYQTVPLDSKVFDPNTGKPKIYTPYMELDSSVVGENIKTEHFFNREIGTWPFKVTQFHYRVFDNQSNQTLTEFKDYYASGEAWFGFFLAPLLTGGETYQCVIDEYGKGRGMLTLEAAFTIAGIKDD
ncbi:hypothetical protein ACFL48_04250 [Pseudomonadota bacterium]